MPQMTQDLQPKDSMWARTSSVTSNWSSNTAAVESQPMDESSSTVCPGPLDTVRDHGEYVSL